MSAIRNDRVVDICFRSDRPNVAAGVLVAPARRRSAPASLPPSPPAASSAWTAAQPPRTPGTSASPPATPPSPVASPLRTPVPPPIHPPSPAACHGRPAVGAAWHRLLPAPPP